LDSDKIEVYHVVEDLIRITEAHDIVRKSKASGKSGKDTQQEFRSKLKNNIDFVDPDIALFTPAELIASSNNPFEK